MNFIEKKIPPKMTVTKKIQFKMQWLLSDNEYKTKKIPLNSVTIPATSSLSHSP